MTADLCTCGHAADWHGHAGTGACEHDGDCGCVRFVDGTAADALRWEPGSLTAAELERVLTDALADLWADCDDEARPPYFRKCLFRERLEMAVTHATGIALCGMPALQGADAHRHSLDMAGHKRGAL